MPRRTDTAPSGPPEGYEPIEATEVYEDLVNESVPYDGPVPEGWEKTLDGAVDPETGEIIRATEPVIRPWRPSKENFVKVRGGGDYLGVRYRILWMRADHPLWTTDVEVIKLDWDEGLAIVRGMVFDENNRLIAADIKTEERKHFTDFLEKACTGAIGRALAGAGYGTEGATELDEGVSAETGEPRIADAPVRSMREAPTASGPINITPSSVPGIRQGGRSERITTSQIAEIARLSREAKLTPERLATLLINIGLVDREILDETNWPVEKRDQDQLLLNGLRTASHDQAGQIIQTLMAAAKAA